jgi:uncharacterized C2H2 Zn-finger protein
VSACRPGWALSSRAYHPLVKKVSDYRKHVEECQALLRGARTPEERQMLLNTAETWEALAVGEAEHFVRCPACGGWIDCRDLAQVFEHEGPLPRPAQDRPQ